VNVRVAHFSAEEWKRAGDDAWVLDHLIPTLQNVEGFRSLFLGIDPASGEGISLTVWETDEDARLGEQAVQALADQVGEPQPRPHSVERYEITYEA
jgi:heme-degrading monooxygenase HmoA